MNSCDGEPGEASPSGRSEDETVPNRIFLNFTRQLTDLERDCTSIDKVKKLFRFLSEREDLQEMKFLGCNEEDEEDSLEEEDEEVEDERSDDKDSCQREDGANGGKRFAMSRDFWYRRLNILKAQKLDEVALDAKDIPSRPKAKELGARIPSLKIHEVYSDQIPERYEDVAEEIDEFERRIARRIESELKTGFLNIYDNKTHFCEK